MHERDLFSAIDLHSNNNYLTVIDSSDHRLFEKRLKNDISVVLGSLDPFKDRIAAVAVESTFNWYWLVDGLNQAGYSTRLVNTSKVSQYEGLKHSDDRHDAFWLAHLMRLGILPTGYIHPPEHRALRDLLRKRMRLVQQRTMNILGVQNLQQRNTGVTHEHRSNQSAINRYDRGVGAEPEPRIVSAHDPGHHPRPRRADQEH